MKGFANIMTGKHEMNEWQTYTLYSQVILALFVVAFMVSGLLGVCLHRLQDYAVVHG